MSTLFDVGPEPSSLATSPHAQAIKPTFANCPILPKRETPPEEAGWWFGTPFEGWPEAGPYETRKEAEEARSSLVRNWIGNLKPREITGG